jgi:quercetin dioxygenase-like cupin family protein
VTFTLSRDVPELAFVGAAEGAGFSPEPGLIRRILANNANLMLVEHKMEPGWAGARHSHPHDQLVYVLSGHLKFGVGDRIFEVMAGDSFVIRGDVEHQAWALAASVVLDVFTPTREDYLPKLGTLADAKLESTSAARGTER